MTIDHGRRHFFLGRDRQFIAPARLPWIISEQHFSSHCTGCGDCLPACPQGILIRGSGDLPQIDFSDNECTFCGECLKACREPLFQSPRPQRAWPTQMTINNSCLANHHIYCQSCRDTCDSDAIHFPLQRAAVPKPVVIQDNCTGCGACVSTCPEQAINLNIQEELYA